MNPTRVKDVPLFAGVSRRERKRIAGLADEIEVTAGTTLTREGELAQEFFVIDQGTAEVSKDGRRVAVLGPGDFFGEVGLLNGPARSATVTATTPMRLLVVPDREFRGMVRSFPPIAARVDEALTARA